MIALYDYLNQFKTKSKVGKKRWMHQGRIDEYPIWVDE
jgi:hypothetical protein